MAREVTNLSLLLIESLSNVFELSAGIHPQALDRVVNVETAKRRATWLLWSTRMLRRQDWGKGSEGV